MFGIMFFNPIIHCYTICICTQTEQATQRTLLSYRPTIKCESVP